MGAEQLALSPEHVLPVVRTFDRAGQALGMMDLHGYLAIVHFNFLLATAISMLIDIKFQIIYQLWFLTYLCILSIKQAIFTKYILCPWQHFQILHPFGTPHQP